MARKNSDVATEVSVDAGSASVETEKKARKPRVAKEKAPSRKENPAGYQAHYLGSAIANISKRDLQTTGWGVDGLANHFRDALFSLQAASDLLKAVPSDFKAPRKRSAGGGRAAKRFAPGQIVRLSDKALEMVKQVFPDYGHDCVFKVFDNMIVSEATKLYSIGTTGIGGALPWAYVGFYAAKDLTAVE